MCSKCRDREARRCQKTTRRGAGGAVLVVLGYVTATATLGYQFGAWAGLATAGAGLFFMGLAAAVAPSKKPAADVWRWGGFGAHYPSKWPQIRVILPRSREAQKCKKPRFYRAFHGGRTRDRALDLSRVEVKDLPGYRIDSTAYSRSAQCFGADLVTLFTLAP